MQIRLTKHAYYEGMKVCLFIDSRSMPTLQIANLLEAQVVLIFLILMSECFTKV